MNIRTATPADAAQLLQIYAPFVENTTVTFEYIVPSAEGRQDPAYLTKISLSSG